LEFNHLVRRGRFKMQKYTKKQVQKHPGCVAGSRFQSTLLAFKRCVRGNTVMMFALALPGLLAAVGVASDYAILEMKRSSLQAAADSSALAAAKELSISSSTDVTVTNAAKNYVNAELTSTDGAAVSTVNVNRKEGSVTVALSESWTPFFAQFISSGITPVNVQATAKLAGSTNICVLSLSPTGVGGIMMTSNSTVTANGCGLYANSTDKQAIVVATSSKITSPLICSGGGATNVGGTTSSPILTGCPKTPDPLAARPAPKYGACDFNKTKIVSGFVTLSPGVYCGGIEVSGTANVTFNPGTYVIKDGLFNVKNTASIKGKNVAFYLTGFPTFLFFTNDATIDLSGAETGDMAGLLFFEDRATGILNIHDISASHANNLTGTIYMPKGNLLVHPAAAIGENSAYTAIVVNRLIVDQGPSLTLNTNYSATQVPVPSGIQATATVVLAN
jgi:Flp pilus assembly protein TadG